MLCFMGGKEVSEELGAFPSAPVPQIFIVTETSFPPPPPNLLLSKKNIAFFLKKIFGLYTVAILVVLGWNFYETVLKA